MGEENDPFADRQSGDDLALVGEPVRDVCGQVLLRRRPPTCLWNRIRPWLEEMVAGRKTKAFFRALELERLEGRGWKKTWGRKVESVALL